MIILPRNCNIERLLLTNFLGWRMIPVSYLMNFDGTHLFKIFALSYHGLSCNYYSSIICLGTTCSRSDYLNRELCSHNCSSSSLDGTDCLVPTTTMTDDNCSSDNFGCYLQVYTGSTDSFNFNLRNSGFAFKYLNNYRNYCFNTRYSSSCYAFGLDNLHFGCCNSTYNLYSCFLGTSCYPGSIDFDTGWSIYSGSCFRNNFGIVKIETKTKTAHCSRIGIGC